jgi:photosystem II stability/assembly factor-like uncharacterized protein
MKNTILLLIGALNLFFSCNQEDLYPDPDGFCDENTTYLAPEGYSIELIGAVDFNAFKIDAFQYIDDNTGYALSTSNAGGFVTLFKTVDGGKTWTDLSVNIAYQAISMAFKVGNAGLISVYDNTGCPANCQDKCVALRTLDGGNSWTIVEYPNLQGFLNHLQFDEEGRLFAMLNRAGVNSMVRSDDGGASFYSINQDSNLGFIFSSFSFQLFQDKIYASGHGGRILVMDKTGNLIKTIQTPLGYIRDLKIIDNNHMVAAFSDNVLKTEDGGISWKPMFAGTARLIDFSSPEEGLILKTKSVCAINNVQTNDLFAKTNDAGETWIEPSETTSSLAFYYSNSQTTAEGRHLMFIGTNLWKLQKN